MIIGGLQKLTLIDYPGEIAAVVFTQGCNFKCHFCYNPMLVVPNYTGSIQKNHSLIKESDFFAFLKNRKNKLDAVVISGGEPTIHKDLPEFIKKIKKLGFKIKLDTNGTNPKMLKNIINNKLINYIAMDLKAPPEKYKKTTNSKNNLSNILESIKIIMTSNIDYEFRTTIVPKLLKHADIDKMGKTIKGAKNWYLQKFKPDTNLINKKFENQTTYNDDVLKQMALIGNKYVNNCKVRL